MKKFTLVFILTGLLVFMTNRSDAQNTHSYLYKVGMVDSVHSDILKETRKIYVQLPDDYYKQPNRTYPVAYILDGEVLLPAVSNALTFYSGGYVPEMVLIGISDHIHRTRDLTPTVIKTKYGMPFNGPSGGAGQFIQFLQKELIPYVDKTYRVTGYRTLIGHSYGGLFTIYTLLTNSDLFANYLAIDPSLDWDHQIILRQAKRKIQEQKFTEKSLFISLNGQLDMQNPDITIHNVMEDTTDYTLFARSNISFRNFLRQHSNNGLFFRWKFYPEEIHGTIAYPSIRDGLVSLFKWFQMENTSLFNSPDTPKELLYKTIKQRESKLRHHFGYTVPPYPEDLLNMLGYMNLRWQHPEKSKMFFKLEIAYYPKSAGAYGSMADFYESQHDTTNTLKYLEKAYRLNSSASIRDKINALKSDIK